MKTSHSHIWIAGSLLAGAFAASPAQGAPILNIDTADRVNRLDLTEPIEWTAGAIDSAGSMENDKGGVPSTTEVPELPPFGGLAFGMAGLALRRRSRR
jgi:hypothetical protein